MWTVDDLTIQIFPGWAGGVNEARYIQIVGYGNLSAMVSASRFFFATMS
jgi:hypothetical protein